MKYDKREATEWVRAHARGFVDTVGTAFTPTLEIDEEGIRRDVRYLVGELGLLGACSTGYNGERGSLTTAETARVNQVMTEECHRVNPDAIAAPCAYHYNMSECIGLIQAAEAAGADIVLLGTMFMEHYPPEVMYRYFKEISDRTSIGIFLMDFPQPIALETLARLAELPNIVGTKQVYNVWQAFEALGDKILISPALEPDLLPAMMFYGGQYLAMVTPPHWWQVPGKTLLNDYFELALKGEYDRAVEIWKQLTPMRQLYEEAWIKPVVTDHIHPAGILKYWESLLGMNGGPVRAPLEECPDHLKVRIRKGLEEFGLISA